MRRQEERKRATLSGHFGECQIEDGYELRGDPTARCSRRRRLGDGPDLARIAYGGNGRNISIAVTATRISQSKWDIGPKNLKNFFYHKELEDSR